MSYSILRDGQRQILEIYVPGDVIGLKTMLNKPHSVSVAAITDVALCGFVMNDVVVQGLRSPSVVAEFIRQLSGQVNTLEDRLIDVGRRSAAPRIASFILRLQEKLAQRGLVNDGSFPFPLRQSHIADALGLTTVHVNRMLGMLRAEGILSFDPGRLTIHKPDHLAEIAESTAD
jgi:CRP-like cAMP-binding protein